MHEEVQLGHHLKVMSRAMTVLKLTFLLGGVMSSKTG